MEFDQPTLDSVLAEVDGPQTAIQFTEDKLVRIHYFGESRELVWRFPDDRILPDIMKRTIKRVHMVEQEVNRIRGLYDFESGDGFDADTDLEITVDVPDGDGFEEMFVKLILSVEVLDQMCDELRAQT